MTEQRVLQVEDDDAGYFVFRELFEKICPDIRLQRAKDGAEAVTVDSGSRRGSRRSWTDWKC
jgi:hypothetical protein